MRHENNKHAYAAKEIEARITFFGNGLRRGFGLVQNSMPMCLEKTQGEII